MKVLTITQYSENALCYCIIRCTLDCTVFYIVDNRYSTVVPLEFRVSEARGNRGQLHLYGTRTSRLQQHGKALTST